MELVYTYRLLYMLAQLRNKIIKRYYDDLIYKYIEVEKIVEYVLWNYFFLNINHKVRFYIKDYNIY